MLSVPPPSPALLVINMFYPRCQRNDSVAVPSPGLGTVVTAVEGCCVMAVMHQRASVGLWRATRQLSASLVHTLNHSRTFHWKWFCLDTGCIIHTSSRGKFPLDTDLGSAFPPPILTLTIIGGNRKLTQVQHLWATSPYTYSKQNPHGPTMSYQVVY